MSHTIPESKSPLNVESLFEAVGGLYAECDDLEGQMEGLFDSLEKLNKQFVRDYASEIFQNMQSVSADGQSEQAANHIKELEEERSALEAELEKVRSRAAELDDAVSQQKQEFDHQQAEMDGELTQLKTLLETQAGSISISPVEESVEEPVEEVKPKKAAAKKKTKKSKLTDPVLDPIMAQFAKLQKQKVKRKKAGE